MKPMGSPLRDPWAPIENGGWNRILGEPCGSKRWSTSKATTRARPASSVMLGLKREIPSRLRKRANLVCTLDRNQLLYRVRFEAVMQGGDFFGQTVDQYPRHLRLPPGGVRITDSAKCPPQLVDQGGPGHG